MTSLDRRLSDIGALADRVADQHDQDRDVTDLADRAVTGMLKALRGVLADLDNIAREYTETSLRMSQQIMDREKVDFTTEDVIRYGAYASVTRIAASRAERIINAAIRTAEPDELDRLVAAVDGGRDSFQRAQHRAMGGVR